ncbi:MAG: hypothetical protein JO180_07755 [Gemmatirosa sp.]|nr:hypothetical protein [Gemmatirosa sp.]
MRRVKICIYGGTDLKGTPPDFVSELAYAILDAMPAVIVTGGFHHSNQAPTAISTDVAALRGARRYAAERQADLRACYEAWIPEPDLDSRPDVRGAVRMSEDDGIAVRVMTGRTPLGRRLAMVGGVDVVITISGRVHTEVVVEQALELGVPVLPIPDAGGDSRDLLIKYRRRIAASFESGALDRCLTAVSHAIDEQPQVAARAVVDLIRTAKVGRCLVLLPYDAEHDALYQATIEPAVARHMIPVRLDRLPMSEAIYTSFADAMQSSSAVIADITTLNENVMYEIGFAHGRGLTPLIYTRSASRLSRLPVYFRTLNVRLASDATPVPRLVEEYLNSLKTTRRLHQYSA